MKLQTYLQTWEGMQVEAKWSRITNGILLCLVVVLTVTVLSKETVVVLQPHTLTQEAWVAEHESSEGYKESWGLYLATMLGNATPETLPFIKERIKPLLGPEIYSDVINVLEVQANELIEDRITMRFEPRSVAYEKSTGKVFVYGQSYLFGSNETEIKTDRTYEFELAIGHYAPVLNYMTTYGGRPRTVDVAAKLSDKGKNNS